MLPNVIDWKGLKLRAEIEVKGMRYPVRWACHQKLNDDGSLTLRGVYYKERATRVMQPMLDGKSVCDNDAEDDRRSGRSCLLCR